MLIYLIKALNVISKAWVVMLTHDNYKLSEFEYTKIIKSLNDVKFVSDEFDKKKNEIMAELESNFKQDKNTNGIIAPLLIELIKLITKEF